MGNLLGHLLGKGQPSRFLAAPPVPEAAVEAPLEAPQETPPATLETLWASAFLDPRTHVGMKPRTKGYFPELENMLEPLQLPPLDLKLAKLDYDMKRQQASLNTMLEYKLDYGLSKRRKERRLSGDLGDFDF